MNIEGLESRIACVFFAGFGVIEYIRPLFIKGTSWIMIPVPGWAILLLGGFCLYIIGKRRVA